MKRHGIRKPRRQHPGALFAQSGAALGFVARVHEVVGPRLTYTPIAQLGSGHNAWRVDGALGRGLWVESEDGPQPGGTFRTRAFFIGHSWSAYPMLCGTLATHGWDSSVAEAQGEAIPKMSDRRRYKLRDERTAEVASRLDAAAWSFWDPDNLAEPLGGIPIALVVTLLDQHIMASYPPPTIERNEGYLRALFSCWNCDWWGRGAALLERRAPDGKRLACPSCETVLTTPTDQPGDPGLPPRSPGTNSELGEHRVHEL